MRRSSALLGVLLVATSLSFAAPASAAFAAIVELPPGPIYSPFGGPATVAFTFDGDDPVTIFTIRLRRPGHGVLREKDVLVDPITMTSPHDVRFAWRDMAVDAPTDLVIDVRRPNGNLVASNTFTLRPPLVSDVSAAPATFYPVIQDGYRDTTRIRFSLAADTTETSVTVSEPGGDGRCCGAPVRSVDLGPLENGRHTWVWDGHDDAAELVPIGRYFVRVRATDADAVTKTTRAILVEPTTGTIRLTATKRKDGSAYARLADEQPNEIGDCIVTRDTVAGTTSVICANALISVVWRWHLGPGERIESVSFAIDEGYYGCYRKKRFTKTEAILRVISPPITTCTISEVRIRYSYPVAA